MYLYSKFSFGEVYRRIYGRKFSLTATRDRWIYVGNLILHVRRRPSGAVKRYFRTYIQRYTSPNVKLEYGYPHSNAILLFCLKFEL